MRRLYSTFAHGLPGAGLLLMRLVAGIALVVEGVMSLRGGISIGAAILHVLGAGAGILLLAGLWTPIAGVLVATLALWQAFSHPGNPWSGIMLGTLGAALAARTWRLVGRCASFWMEAHRHSRSKELSLYYF